MDRKNIKNLSYSITERSVQDVIVAVIALEATRFHRALLCASLERSVVERGVVASTA